MSSPDAAAVELHPLALTALERGEASDALRAVEGAIDAAALRIMGRALLALGDRAGARRALGSALAAAGDDPTAASLAHEHLAVVARTTGELDEAAGHLDAALDHAPAGARAYLHREAAALALRRGALSRAERHALWVLDATAADGATAADRLLLGSILSEQDRHAEAIVHLREAVDTMTIEHGTTHFDVSAAQTELATAFQAAGLLDDAAATHRSILERRSAALGPTHPWLASTCLALSEIATQQTDADAARVWAARAVAILDGRVPSDDPQLCQAKATVAR